MNHYSTLAPGIEFVSTPGHGFVVISQDRLEYMREYTPALLTPTSYYPHHRTGFDNARSFEEDLEYARVFLAFPDCFTDDQVQAARRAMEYSHPEILAAFDQETTP